MTAAVNNLTEQAHFQKNYQTLLRHYGLRDEKSRPDSPTKTVISNSGIIGCDVPWTRHCCYVAVETSQRWKSIEGFWASCLSNSTAGARCGWRKKWSCCGHCRIAGWEVRSGCGHG